jgi:hypothetical protein
VLLEHWDVLAVAEQDVAPQTEYLHEAGEVLDLLQAGRSADEVAAHLGDAATLLGATPDARRDRLAAEAVMAEHGGSR